MKKEKSSNKQCKLKCGYLSGALRVTTDPEAATAGPRSHILGTIKGLKNNGCIVEPWIFGDRIPTRFQKSGAGNLAEKGGIKTILSDLFRLFLSGLNSLRAYCTLKSKVNFVYERQASLQSLGWLFKKAGIPWVYETNGPFYLEATKDRGSVFFSSIAKKIEKYCYYQADIIVTITPTLKSFLIEDLDIPENKFCLIPNGVDIEFFNPNKFQSSKSAINKEPQENINIGFVGELREKQGIDDLILALDSLKESKDIFTVTLIGDGPYKNGLKYLAKSKNLTDRIKFLGYKNRDLIPKLINDFDIGFVGKKRNKTNMLYDSPLKLYEYLAMAKPAISSKTDDALRVIKEGVTGFLYEPGNIQSLRDVLKEVVEAKDMLSVMGRKARLDVERNHNWQARTKELIERLYLLGVKDVS